MREGPDVRDADAQEAVASRRRPSRRLLAVTVVAGALAVVAVVVVIAMGRSDGSPVGPVAVYEDDMGEGTMDAELHGVLALEDDCLVVWADRADDPVIPVLDASDVTWSGDALIYRGQHIAMGTEVLLGGGFLGSDSPAAAHVPDGCSGEYAQFLASSLHT